MGTRSYTGGDIIGGEFDRLIELFVDGDPIPKKNSKKGFVVARKGGGVGRKGFRANVVADPRQTGEQNRLASEFVQQIPQGIRLPFGGRLLVVVEFAVKSFRIIDANNVGSMVADALKLAGVIADDNIDVVPTIVATGRRACSACPKLGAGKRCKIGRAACGAAHYNVTLYRERGEK